MYLLSYLCLLNIVSGQDDFVKFVDPAAEEYGKILSPELPDSIADQLLTTKLTFPEWASFYSIRTVGSTRSVLGDYRVEKNRTAFSPRFLPDPDVDYIVSFNFNKLNEVLNISFRSEKDSLIYETVVFKSIDSQASEILQIYPHINVLPENALRLYIYFSKPMSFENPYDHISLLDQRREKINNAFVVLPKGLWNEDRTRLTVLLHPGRVKQGVGPNLIEGSVLKEGNLYELAISEEWKDANGMPLSMSFSKKFYATKAQRNKLRKKDWVINSICKDECILKLSTGDIPDIELVDNMIAIENEKGKSIDFNFYPEDNGSFLIRSDAFKKETRFTMVINPRMEDISGNSFLNAFDSKEGTRIKEGKPIEIQIVIK